MSTTATALGTTLRLVGLSVCVLAQGTRVIELLSAGPTGVLRRVGVFDLSGLVAPSPGLTLAVGVVLPLVLFGGLFWWTARGVELPREPRPTLLLLALLTLVAALLALDYVFLVASMAAILLSVRRAFAWLGAQILLVSLVVLIAQALGARATFKADPALSPGMALGVDMIELLVWQAFAFAIGYVAAEETLQRRELARLNAELLATRQLIAEGSRIAERARVSGALAERLGSRLAGLAVSLDLVARTNVGRLAEAVQEARGQVLSLLNDLRKVAHSLDTDARVDPGRALRLLVAAIHTPAIHLQLPADIRLSDPEHAHAIFRCAQEAITNAVKHSDASDLWLEVQREPDRIVLEARDNGRGAATVAPGNGLTGMRERLDALRGRLEIVTAPAKGFHLRVSIPHLAPE
jgi:signal transduction histidine kinase